MLNRIFKKSNKMSDATEKISQDTTSPKPNKSFLSKLAALSIKSKLLLMLLLTSLISMAVITFLGYDTAEKALTAQVHNQLTSLRSAKKQQIERYFEDLKDTFSVMGKDPTIATAFASFFEAFNELKYAPLSDLQTKNLEDYYRHQFLEKMANKNKSEKPATEEYWPRSIPARRLQSLYIAENPNIIGEKDNLIRLVVKQSAPPKLTPNGKVEDKKIKRYPKTVVTGIAKSIAPGVEMYNEAHIRYHAWFRDFVEKFNFYDAFLIDARSGNIVYSVFKEADYATSLEEGPFANSNLARLYKKVVREHIRGKVDIVDFAPYAASYYAPAAFMATPVYVEGKFRAVLAVQLSVKDLNSFMTYGKKWKESGLGDSGQLYLVGPDKTMRSDSRFLLENKKGFISALKKAKVPSKTIEKIKNQNTTVLFSVVDSETANKARRGQSGIEDIKDYRNVDVISAYAPMDIAGLRWVIISEKDAEEALRSQTHFKRKVVIAACIIALLVTLLAMFMSASFLRPVTALLEGVERLNTGDSDFQIPPRSNDEFGDLTRAFNGIVSRIHDRDVIIAEQKTSYEALLRKLFPETVARRLQKGDVSFADNYPQVSVIYVMVSGFSHVCEDMSGEDSLALLNRIVNAFDQVGLQFGVEKVKTIGEHYLAACGLSVPRLDHAERSMAFAHEINNQLMIINKDLELDLSMRIGIHSGGVHAGIVGQHRFDYDIWGPASNLSRRITYEADFGHVRITRLTHALLGEPGGFDKPQVIKTKGWGEITSLQIDLTKAKIRIVPTDDDDDDDDQKGVAQKPDGPPSRRSRKAGKKNGNGNNAEGDA